MLYKIVPFTLQCIPQTALLMLSSSSGVVRKLWMISLFHFVLFITSHTSTLPIIILHTSFHLFSIFPFLLSASFLVSVHLTSYSALAHLHSSLHSGAVRGTHWPNNYDETDCHRTIGPPGSEMKLIHTSSLHVRTSYC